VTAEPLTRVSATLGVAATEAEREAAIGAWLQAPRAATDPVRRVIIAEGVLFDRAGPNGVPIIGLAAGCPCCTGSVALRVALGRTLRSTRPEAVLLLLQTAEHLPRLRRMLVHGELGVRFEVEKSMERVRVNGIDIAYRLDGDGAPTRPWLVFAHALGHDLTMWDAQVEAFGRGCNILRYDLRGHGLSDAPPGDYTLEQMTDDLRELLDHLAIRRCHFIGLSLGAMIGQLAAIRAPLRIASLTLAGAACRFSPQMQPLWAGRIAAVRSALGMDAIVDATISGWFTAGFFATRAADVARSVQVLRRTPVNGYAGAIAAMSRADLSTRLSAVACPVLVVAGADDRVVPFSYAEQILLHLHQARLQRITGAAHLSNIEQAADFNAALREFLAGESTP